MADSPTVHMLWESADPHAELTTRFGFPDDLAVVAWVADVLGRHWALDEVRCDRLVISDCNLMAWVQTADGPFIVKWSARPERFAQLEIAARVVAWLATDADDIPVAAPRPTTDDRLLVELDDDPSGPSASPRAPTAQRFLIGVLPVMSGALLDVDDPAQVDNAGRMLATLHRALARCPEPIAGRGPAAQQQLVHHDFRAANILHDGTRITAVLDFEELTWTTRVTDLARSAVLLATRYRDWTPPTAAARAAYIDAYDRHGDVPLTTAERHELAARIDGTLQAFGWT